MRQKIPGISDRNTFLLHVGLKIKTFIFQKSITTLLLFLKKYPEINQQIRPVAEISFERFDDKSFSKYYFYLNQNVLDCALEDTLKIDFYLKSCGDGS